jgi:hypothetical protein
MLLGQPVSGALPAPGKVSGALPAPGKVSGVYGAGVPPVPIPNTEVKTRCGDNTWGTSPRKDSTTPDLYINTPRDIYLRGCLSFLLTRWFQSDSQVPINAPKESKTTSEAAPQRDGIKL